MVCSCPLGVLALRFPKWCRPSSAPTCVFPRVTLPELLSNLTWLLLVLDLDIPRRSRAVNLGWLLLPVLGLGLIEASRSLFERV